MRAFATLIFFALGFYALYMMMKDARDHPTAQGRCPDCGSGHIMKIRPGVWQCRVQGCGKTFTLEDMDNDLHI